MQGFQEAHSAFLTFDETGHVGQVRRFGPYGPAYEVVAVHGDGDLEIEVVQSGESVRYALTDFLSDPTAVTVP
jgi:Family of unknown function (DUF5397)